LLRRGFSSELVDPKDLSKGYRMVGSKKLGAIRAALKSPITEGSEEMNQQWIASTADNYYSENDINDFWRKRTDPKTYK
jgi:hypothetical protein